MANVYLTCVADRSGIADGPLRSASTVLRSAAEGDARRQHRLVEGPEAADLILFAESHGDDAACGPYFEALRGDPVYRRFRDKSVVISGMDRIVPLVPGIFASIERRWHRAPIARPGPYLVATNPYLRFVPADRMPGAAAWLASFVGCAQGIPVRQRLLGLVDPRFHVRDNTEAFVGAIRSRRDEDLSRLKTEYVDISLASRFILCPRGFGASSIRLYEAMQMGRAPVVLSDDWVPPSGPRWDEFLVRVPEKEASRLPSILGEREADAVAMGAASRRAWEQHFGPGSLFHWVVEEGLRIRETSLMARDVACSLARLQLLTPFHLRRGLRRVKAWGSASLGRPPR